MRQAAKRKSDGADGAGEEALHEALLLARQRGALFFEDIYFIFGPIEESHNFPLLLYTRWNVYLTLEIPVRIECHLLNVNAIAGRECNVVEVRELR